MDASTKLKLKEKVVEMFNHAYGSYMKNAFPADELMPLSCKGRYRGSEVNRGDIDDSLGNFSLTLIDSLDTIALLGDINEFDKAVKLVISHSKFDTNVVVSVFETNIRVLGGLLGGHVLAIYLRKRKLGMEWYKDELLGMAKDIGTRLLPAFNTTTGIPYPRINLKHGIEPNIAQNYRDTCTACAGTMILEFAALSRLTGDPVFEEKAHRAMDYLWNQRHRSSDLVGTVINIHNGDWIRRESGVGAGIDSYYEYVLKAYILLGDDTYLTRFNKHYDAVKKYISQGPRFIDVHMHRPQSVSRNFMDALLAFWPGLQVLKGDIQPAIEVHEMLYQVIQRHNFLPEAFTSDFHVHWGHHPLRPEFVESTYFLYKATGDSHYLDVGQKVIENLDVLARVPCGFAAIKDVTKGTHEDQMDSYVLAETFKYLFLLFAEKEDLLIDVDDYVFTTEAHLLPLSLSRCNSSKTAELRLSRELYRHLQQLDDESRTEDEYGDSDHNTCPNPQVKYTLNYAHNLREGLKDMMLKSPRLAPQQCSQAQQNIPTLRAVEFVAGNQEQLAQLEDMGIKLITIADGRLQLLHTATDALSTAHAQQGLRFMQEMIELQKNLPKDNSKQNEPVSIKVLTTPHEKMVYRGGPALFGYDLSKRPSVQGKLVVGDPYKMCTSDIPNKERLKGRIAIVERGDCMFVDKARQLQGAGAIGALVIDHNVGTSVNTHPLFALSGDGRDDVYIPMVFLFHNEGQHLRTLLATNPDLEVSILSKTESTGQTVSDTQQAESSHTVKEDGTGSHDSLSGQSEARSESHEQDPTQSNANPPSLGQESSQSASLTDQEFKFETSNLRMEVKTNFDKHSQSSSLDENQDVIQIYTDENGVNQIFFRFDKLKGGTDGTPVLEEIYEELRNILFKKTNFRLLERQSSYLNAIVRLLSSAYFGNGKVDKNTEYLFAELAKELKLVELDSSVETDQSEQLLQNKDQSDSSSQQENLLSVEGAVNAEKQGSSLYSNRDDQSGLNREFVTIKYSGSLGNNEAKAITVDKVGIRITTTDKNSQPDDSQSINDVSTVKFDEIKHSFASIEDLEPDTSNSGIRKSSLHSIETQVIDKDASPDKIDWQDIENRVKMNEELVNGLKKFIEGIVEIQDVNANPEPSEQTAEIPLEQLSPHSREYQERKYKVKPKFEKTVRNLKKNERPNHPPHDEH
ncbi:hypothetical protein DPMN_147326 [Dreissena polymorpha]|uniref:alpha-1,2-Mannosidase n=2 Tax=Dreissena polymorpha TaxID=45954 RepID=A0A9D4J2W2_DREPO|nr:hypothetical protein DPMN_147326 [Dreissena polymorpha]